MFVHVAPWDEELLALFEYVDLALRLMDGGFAWLHASWTERKNLFSLEIAKIEIVGLGGSYGTEALTPYEMRPELGPPHTTTKEWDQPDDSWARELHDVMRAVQGEHGIGATIGDGVAALRAVGEAYGRSSWSTPPVAE